MTVAMIGAPTHKHLRLVPQCYHKSSGLRASTLVIRNAWHRPYFFMRHPEGGAISIKPAAYCELWTEAQGSLFLLVDVASMPVLAEATLLIGKLFFTGNRIHRYTTLYNAYECVEPNPDIMLSAVRHGLSHAPATLSRRKTIEALQLLFGTTRIDLRRTRHQRAFYNQFVSLLRATDKALSGALIRALPQLLQVISEDIPLHEWQIHGMPGIREPVPLREEFVQ